MNKIFLAASLAALFVTGCASRGQATDTTAATTASSSAGDAGSSNAANGSGIGNGQPIGSGSNNAMAGYDLSKKTVYFAFDASDIDAEGQTVVDNYAKYLTSNSSVKVKLEGNTDERGSNEYNLALSERRAQAVATALKAKGVADSQLSLLSYGEEHPADPGHDEAAWAKNRRVDITQ